MKRLLLALVLLLVSTAVAMAQTPDLNALLPQGSGSAAARIIQLVALLTVLSVAPGLLIMVTSFTRFIVALSFLRSGLGFGNCDIGIITNIAADHLGLQGIETLEQLARVKSVIVESVFPPRYCRVFSSHFSVSTKGLSKGQGLA